MKKLLILTIYDNFNYGNRLQNFAMQSVLKKFNKDVYTLNNASLCYKKQNNAKRIKKITLKKLINKVRKIVLKPIYRKRFKVFEKFSDTLIKQTRINTYDEINKEFSMICIGSDQIWNPYFLNNFYYSFGKFSNNAFSYAASFGIEKIPDEYKEEIKDGLEKIKNISVREEKGADIVEEFISKRPEVNIDPTLLLTYKEWNKIVEIPKSLPNKKYILTYFLGKYSNKRRKYINDFAKKNNLEVVSLAQIKDIKYYFMGPSEFLYFIKNCEMVLTDSFHGAIFSIIYKKPFYIFNREEKIESMNSRIETLLKKFDLKEREIKDYSQSLEFDCDFSKVDSILEIERKKSMEYLKNAIN